MSKYRVGYYLEVEVNAIDSRDAQHIADAAIGFWDRVLPRRVFGMAMGKRCDADIRRIEILYAHPKE